MNKWLFLAAAFGLLACSDQDLGDEGLETLEQVGADGGRTSPTRSLDAGTVTSTPGLDAGSSSADAGSSSASSGAVGSACMGNSDCASGYTCTTQVSIPFGGLNINFPGGYCSKRCTADSDCTTGTACPLAGAAAFVPEIAQCLKQCTSASECRQGYSCTTLPSIAGGLLGGSTGSASRTHCLPPLPFPGGGGLPGGGGSVVP